MLSTTGLEPVALFAALAVVVIVRQTRPRRIRGAWSLLIPAALVVWGLRASANLSSSALGAPLAMICLLAAGAAVLRAMTFRIWHDERGACAQGTLLTLVVWILLGTARAGLGLFGVTPRLSPEDLSNELPLVLGVTFGIQNIILRSRSRLLAAQALAPAAVAIPVSPAPFEISGRGGRDARPWRQHTRSGVELHE